MAQAEVAVSERVIQNVATATNRDAVELPPLYGVVDPDALDTVVEELSDGEVSFTYAGVDVTVTADGTVTPGTQSTDYGTAETAVSGD